MDPWQGDAQNSQQMNVVKHFATSGLAVACGVSACGGTPREPRVEASVPAPPLPAGPTPCRQPAIDAETKACLADPEPASCLVTLARARAAGGEEQAAADALAHAIAAEPAARKPYLELAILLHANNRYDLAAKVLGEAKRFVLGEERFLVHYVLASSFAVERNLPASVAELEAALALAPHDADVAFNLALSYTRLAPQKGAEAKALLERVLPAICGDGGGEAACALGKSTLARIAGEQAWPPETVGRSRVAAYPTPACVPEAVAEGEPALPVLELPRDPVRRDSAFTVWGASHHLRSEPHRRGVTAGPITVTGFVVATNYDEAPACAIHRAGKSDPPHCRAPAPTFYLADSLESPTSVIPVMGWASTWSTVYEAMRAIDREGPDAEVIDSYLGTRVPSPIPAVGARVSVTGTYDFSFTNGAAVASDPRFGILGFQRTRLLAPAPAKASLPGVPRR